MNNTKLILGTAMWGWSIEEKECFKILDLFYSNGYREIDSATNYPINRDIQSFRKAEKILKEWIKTNNIRDLKINLKIGSLSNSGSPDINLKKSFLLLSYDYYRSFFKENLFQIMIHWDNRNNQSLIEHTIDTLVSIQDTVKVGLSGIKHPELYKSFVLNNKINIQMKHNLFSSDNSHYSIFKGKKLFTAYGLNSGGFKPGKSKKQMTTFTKRQHTKQLKIMDLKWKEIEEKIKHINTEKIGLNKISMINCFFNKDIIGVVTGPSNTNQLKDTITFHKATPNNNHKLIYKALNK